MENVVNLRVLLEDGLELILVLDVLESLQFEFATLNFTLERLGKSLSLGRVSNCANNGMAVLEELVDAVAGKKAGGSGNKSSGHGVIDLLSVGGVSDVTSVLCSSAPRSCSILPNLLSLSCISELYQYDMETIIGGLN